MLVMSSIRAPAVDSFILKEDRPNGLYGVTDTYGLTRRSTAINPALDTLVLVVAGQSLVSNATPTLFTPVNSSVVDQMNIYDGGIYNISGKMLGCSSNATLGPGNVCARIADLFITNAIFDRVILVPIAIGSTYVADWATGTFSDRIACAMRRLSSRGITAATTGVTMAMLWAQGEQDNVGATSQANYTSRLNTVISNAQAAGMSGRIFVNSESWSAGATASAVTSAQAAVVNGTTVFAGANWDSLDATNRQADNTHFNDTGAASAATLVYNAMHATGSPF